MQVQDLSNFTPGTELLDVRLSEEWAAGHVGGDTDNGGAGRVA